jgi:NAD-reducing hydrogenase small subunit
MKPKIATVWLDGCSGCHMSLLDLDERLLELSQRFELVYSPLVDIKEFPPDVDVTLVEGAVSSEADLAKILQVRQRSRFLLSLGDCAVTGNIPSLRNPLDRLDQGVLEVYQNPPRQEVPGLLWVKPLHQVVKVDYYLPGCPPSAKTIGKALEALLDGREPDLSEARFGN